MYCILEVKVEALHVEAKKKGNLDTLKKEKVVVGQEWACPCRVIADY